MPNLPTNRTTSSSTADHVTDHNTLHAVNNILDAKGDIPVGSAADTWARLPVGTNGHVLTADSAEATGLKWAAQSGSTVRHKFTNRTSGNITINSTSWANLDTGMDIVLAAAVGDTIEVGLNAYVSPNSSIEWAALDVASIVSAAPVNYWSGGSSNGIPSWAIAGTRGEGPIGGSRMKAIVSGDLSGGNVTLRLRYKTNNAVNHTVRASANDPLQFYAKNLGPAAA